MTPTTTTLNDLMKLSIKPIKRAFKCIFLRAQLRGIDNHIDHLRKSIENDQKAVRVLETDRINVASALRDALRS